jgi:hypothetical protein
MAGNSGNSFPEKREVLTLSERAYIFPPVKCEMFAKRKTRLEDADM